jgi:acyl carrier protein
LSIKTQVREFITDNFMLGRDAGDLKDSGSLLEMNIIDSTGVLELVGFIEETFEITIEDDELIPENLDSLDKIENYIKRKQQ